MSNTHTAVELVPIAAASHLSIVSYTPHDLLDYLDLLHTQAVDVHSRATGLYQMSIDDLPTRCMFKLVRHDRARTYRGKPLYWEL